MRYEDSLMHNILAFPKESYERLGVYHFALALPFVLVGVIIGVAVAIFADFIRAVSNS